MSNKNLRTSTELDNVHTSLFLLFLMSYDLNFTVLLLLLTLLTTIDDV